MKHLLKHVIKTIMRPILVFKNREHKTHYGKENSDKTFYIYGADCINGGLWWLINQCIMHIGYAIDKGYIPVIDYKNYRTQYSSNKDFKKNNIWEYYFDQPMGWSLHDISKSKNVIISSKSPSPNPKYFMGQDKFYDNPQKIAYFGDICKKYIIPNKHTKKYLDLEYDKVFRKNNRVLGVLCRGTDYLINKPFGHPIQPDPKDVIELADSVMREYNCNTIYLATEDSKIYDLFKNHFNDKLMDNNQIRINPDNLKNKYYTSLSQANVSLNDELYLMGLKYFTSVYILSRCNCFIGGRTGGTKGVLLMSNGFEYQHIFNLGIFQ